MLKSVRVLKDDRPNLIDICLKNFFCCINILKYIFRSFKFFPFTVNPFHGTGLFLYPQKIEVNQVFDVFIVYRKRPVECNGLKEL